MCVLVQRFRSSPNPKASASPRALKQKAVVRSRATSQVAKVAPSHRSRWTHGRRLTAALKLLDDPVLGALMAPAVDFHELPAKLASIFDPHSNVICQLIRYPA